MIKTKGRRSFRVNSSSGIEGSGNPSLQEDARGENKAGSHKKRIGVIQMQFVIKSPPPQMRRIHPDTRVINRKSG